MSVTLHHTEHGPTDGALVVAIHGWMTDHRLMTGCLEPVFEGREQAYRRLYPDLPGMGQTPAGGVDSADDLLAAVEAFLDEHVGDAPFVLFGESYGGYLARAITARRAVQVLGLGLICPVGATVPRDERDLPAHEVLVAEADVDPESDYADNFVIQTADTYERSQDEVARGAKIADKDALERIEEDFELSFDPEAGAPYDGPTLFFTGRQDAVVGYRDQWALLEHYPHATFAVVDGAGHSAQIERGALFEALVHELLDRVELARESSAD